MMFLESFSKFDIILFFTNQGISNIAFRKFEKFLRFTSVILKILIFLFLFKMMNSKSSYNDSIRQMKVERRLEIEKSMKK